MIRNDREHREAQRRITEERKRIEMQAVVLAQQGLTAEQCKRALDPIESFHLQLVDEVEYYERLKAGDLGVLENLHGLGRTLVGLRIVFGMSQAELAKQLGVDPSSVSRDERNEYHGITVQRASRILDVLGVSMTSRFEKDNQGQTAG